MKTIGVPGWLGSAEENHRMELWPFLENIFETTTFCDK